ncbi:hypothetical protein N9H90_10900, partial [Pseudomonadales bacterium]|nr:hypothetical protein [Pseudomonadales bacterium]
PLQTLALLPKIHRQIAVTPQAGGRKAIFNVSFTPFGGNVRDPESSQNKNLIFFNGLTRSILRIRTTLERTNERPDTLSQYRHFRPRGRWQNHDYRTDS